MYQFGSLTYQRFNRRDLSGYSRQSPPPITSLKSWRSTKSSEIMDTIDTSDIHKKSSILLSPTLQRGNERSEVLKHRSIRTEWKGGDRNDINPSKFELPHSLKTLDIKKAEKEALSAFGTTPDKILFVKETRKRGEIKKGEINKMSSSANINVKAVSFSAAPNLSTPKPYDTTFFESTIWNCHKNVSMNTNYNFLISFILRCR